MKVSYALTAGVRAPHGVAFAHGRLLIVSTGDHELVIHDAAALPGGTATRFGGLGTAANAEGLLFPAAACFLNASELIVADTQNKHLDHYKLAGNTWTWEDSISLGGLAPPAGYLVDVIPDPAGGVYVLDGEHHRILRVAFPGGGVSLHLDDPAWREPVAMATGGGYLWVADAGQHRVYRYTAALAQSTFGGYGRAEGRLRSPRGIAYDAVSDRVLVAEADNARISVFDVAGVFETAFVMPAGVHETQKIAAGPGTTFFVADAGNNTVYALDTTSQGAQPRLSRSGIDFGAVGVGYRLPQPVTVHNAGDAPTQVLSAACTGTTFLLTQTPSLPATVPPGGTLELTVSFAPNTTGAMAGELQVHTDAPEKPTLFCSVHGEGFQASPVALGFVLDRSGSMIESSGAMSKMDRLRTAAATMLDMLPIGNGGELTLVPFSSTATVLLPLSSLTIASHQTAQAGIASLAPGGMTSIGAGLQTALNQLSSATNTRRNVIVLSDGIENWPPMLSSVSVPGTVRVFTIGLGLPQHLDAARLQALASVNGGYFQITDGADHLLPKFFTQIFADVFGQQLAVDPVFQLGAGDSRNVRVPVTPGDRALTVVLTWENAKSHFDLLVHTPAGATVGLADFDRVASGPRRLTARLPLRGSRWEAPGQWIVEVQCVNAGGAERAVASVVLESDFHMHWEFIPHQPDPRVHKPKESLGGSQREVFPDIGAGPVPVVPDGLRVGDKLVVAVGPRPSHDGVRMVDATVLVRTPSFSLEEWLRRYGRVDLDRLVKDRQRQPRPHPRGECRRHSARPDKDGKVVIPMDLDGPDGIYELRMRTRARTRQGWMIQRERMAHIVVAR